MSSPLPGDDPPHLGLDAVRHARRLLDSYRLWRGEDLLPRSADPAAEARALFEAPLAVLSHDGAADPRLNYVNRTAARLWEAEADELLGLPSRLTAEPEERSARTALLARAAAEGGIGDYRGVRISRRGTRFLIEGAAIWTVRDEAGQAIGQAAAFAQWRRLTA